MSYPFGDQDQFSFMMMRPGGQGSWSFRLSKGQFYSIIIGSFIFAILTIVALYIYTKTGQERADYSELKEKTAIQESQLEELNQKTEHIQNKIQNLIEKEDQIRYILEEDGNVKLRNRPRRRRSMKLPHEKFAASFKALKPTANPNASIDQRLDFFASALEKLDSNMDTHHYSIVRMKTRFASTPSIWPVHGRIKSGYGYRTHPITGKRRFHQGIDIPAWVGAPIKVAADGVVEYSGWSGGYGYVVIVNHSYRYRTIYAHASQLMVRRGETVRKGQAVAQVGSTGLSTAPHVHYEVWVRKRGKRKMAHVKPNAFLNLDFFSANRLPEVWDDDAIFMAGFGIMPDSGCEHEGCNWAI